MPNVFGREANSVEEIVGVFRAHGDRVRETYRARYVWSPEAGNPYAVATALERPESLRANPPDVVFPWEQVFIAAVTCAGSDYPMLAGHLGIALERAELTIDGVFDPRGEFDGLAGFQAPADAAPCYLSLHLRAVLDSPAPRERLEALHQRVVARNMVLGALRGIPRTSALTIRDPRAPSATRAGGAPRAD
ncbi:MAG TPA: hypothetical protein VHM31_19045 [Polyangia bacterium]|nr:hypothetical protein [Polyangia bacterium]